MAANVGYATLSIIPSAKGFSEKLGAETDGALGAAGRRGGGLFSEGLTGALGPAAAAVASVFAAGSAYTFFKDAISEASDLNESLNAVSVTYGENAQGVLALGAAAAKSLGLSNTEFNSLAVRFSAFSKTIAGEGGNVVGTLEDLTGRASDFASVMNLEVSDAAELFQSGLAGETEPLRKYGIDLSAAAVEAYALANGIAENAASMTEAQKVQARYGSLMEQTAQTQGDFSNTSTSLANAQRILGASWDNVTAKMGAAFLPTLEKIVGVLATGLVPWVSSSIDRVSALVGLFTTGNFSKAFADAFQVTEDAPLVDFLLDLRDTFLDVRSILSTGFTENETLLPPAVVQGLRDFRQVVLDTGSAFSTTLGPAAGSLGTAVGPLVPLLVALVTAFSPLGIALAAIGPAIPPLVAALVPLITTLATDLAGAIATILPAVVTLSATLSGVLAGAVQIALPIIVGFFSFISQNTGLVWAVVGAFVAWKAITGTIALVSGAMAAFRGIMLAVTAASYGQAGATYAVTASQKAAYAAALLMNGTIAAQVAGLARSTAAWIANAAAQVATKVATVVSTVVTVAQTIAQWALNAAFLANPITWVVLALVALVAAIVWVATQTTFFQDAWAAVSSWFVSTWETISSFFVDLWNGIVDFLVTVGTAVWNAIVGFVQPIIDYWRLVWLGVQIIFGAVWNALASVFQAAWQIISDLILIGFTVVSRGIEAVLGFISGVWNAVWGGISAFFEALWNGIVAAVTLYIRVVSTVIETVLNFITGVWTSVWDGISGFFRGVWESIVGFVTAYINVVSNVIRTVLSTVSGIWNSAWSGISSFFSGIWNGIVSGVSGALENIFGFFRGVQGTVLNILGGAGRWLVDVGRNLIQGFLDGIGGASRFIRDAILAPIQGGIDAVKSFLGIRSPSRLMMQIGGFTTEGMARGLERGADRVAEASAALVPTIPSVSVPDVPGVSIADAITASSARTGSRIEGSLDMGDGLVGYVRAVVVEELETESATLERGFRL